MSKYEAKLDLDSLNSLSLMLKNIEKKSVILEFGPATGRLTRYLKEELDCKIYIVEINALDFNESIKYAEDGFLGDIEEYKWLEKFQSIKFDYILFADVLEHLLRPEMAIENSMKLLADNGRIIVSIPNVAHNSIIFNLLKNEFQYNKLGLLDNTHVHLFAYESARRLLEKNNLVVIKEDATYSREQQGEFPYSLNECTQIESEVLINHPMGQVYQFIFVAIRKEFYEKQNFSVEKKIQKHVVKDYCTLYLDTGIGFSEQETLQQSMSNGLNQISFNLSKINLIKSLRLDFGEGFSNIVKINEIKINDNVLETEKLYGNFCGNYKGILTFAQTDPFILFENLSGKVTSLEITFEINKIYDNQELLNNYLIKYGSAVPLIELKDNHISNLENMFREQNKVVNESKIQIIELNKQLIEKDEVIYKLNTDINIQDNTINQQHDTLHQQSNTINQLNQDILKIDQRLQMLKRAIRNPFYGAYLLIKRIQKS